MYTDEMVLPTSEMRESTPIKERAEVSCRYLWERIPAPKEPADFPRILRLSRHGMKLAVIAESEYYRELFTTMKDTVERRLNT
jgi:hypothetical protein